MSTSQILRRLATTVMLAALLAPSAHAQARANDAGDQTRTELQEARSVNELDRGAYTPGDKLVRGLANVFTGFLEVPRNIYNTTQDRNMLMGWTVGLGRGLGYTGLRMVTGLYDVITFPFPVPQDYRPIVRPEYVWQAPGPSYIG